MEENKRNSRKTGLLLSILGVISLVLITAGVTYAFFSYAKEGQTENTITTGTIRFAYDEVDAIGDGILIEDALPLTDEQGKALSDSTKGQAFHFTVTSITPSTAKIPYVVTVRKQDTSTLADAQVKLYLTATGSETGNGTTDNSGVVRTFAQLPNVTTNEITNDLYATVGETEKILFTGEVPASSNNNTGNTPYETSFVLRMWLNGDVAGTNVNYSSYEFVKKSAVTGNTALSAEDLIQSGDLITSTAYYSKPASASAASCSVDLGGQEVTEANCTTAGGQFTAAVESGRDAYERIAYVNTTDKTIYTRSQAIALGYANELDEYGNFTYSTTNGTVENFTQTEQYYQINGQTFKVKVNVYAQGAKVTN